MFSRALSAGLALFLTAAGAASAGESQSYERLRFPQNFKWCVATAGHQIEGYNVHSDWWQFEQVPGNIANGDVSGAACDHWNRVPEDTLLMKRLGIQQYRFSVEWAKIEPREGEYDLGAILHYVMELAALRLAGIEPMVTINHFVLPQWVREKGGWHWDGMPFAFERYTRYLYRYLGESVVEWNTINEPMVHIMGAYVAGLTPPQMTDIRMAGIAIEGMLRSHAAAYHALHELAAKSGREVKVGIAKHLRVFDPHSPANPADRYAANLFARLFNWAFLDAIETGRLKLNIPFALNVNKKIPRLKGTQDFLGLNYYSRDLVKVTFKSPNALPALLIPNPASAKNDLGWEIYPYGFYRLLKEAHKRYPRLRIRITENGTADHSDAFRSRFLKDHLKAIHQAIQEGVPVDGYCHWSLMDNFEWIEGFEPRFGLFEMNYSTMERIERPSARLYRQIIRSNGFDRDASEKWGSWPADRE